MRGKDSADHASNPRIIVTNDSAPPRPVRFRCIGRFVGQAEEVLGGSPLFVRFVLVVTILVAGGSVVAARPAAGAADSVRFKVKRVETVESAPRVRIALERNATASLSEAEASFESADGSATAAADYMAVRGRIRMMVGQTADTIDIALFDDSDEEATETFVLRLTDAYDRSEVIDEVLIVLQDDDRTTAIAASDSEPPAARVDVAPPTTAPAPRADVVVRAAARPRPRAAPAESKMRVTPFELHAPGSASERLPTPEHVTPVAGAGLLAALALGRVAAEFWYRWRVRDI